MKKAPWEKLMISMNPKIRFRPRASRTSTAPLTIPVKTWLTIRCMRREDGIDRTRAPAVAAAERSRQPELRAARRLLLAGGDGPHDRTVAVGGGAALRGRLVLGQPLDDVGGLEGLVVAGTDGLRSLGQVEAGAGQGPGELGRGHVSGGHLLGDQHDRVVDVGGVPAGGLAVGLLVVLDELLRARVLDGPVEVGGPVGPGGDVEAHLLVEAQVLEELEDLHPTLQVELLR